MSYTILLYGATGFSGGLIAAEFRRSPPLGERIILAARDGDRLRKFAKDNNMGYRAFSLDTPAEVRRNLGDVDLLINAAGPFALTADRLAKSALDAGVHYVDINGELDVYKKLDDLGTIAVQRKCAMVCSSGCTAAASNLLLDAALRKLSAYDDSKKSALGAVRIAVSRAGGLSRGSFETVARSLREQVTVVRGVHGAKGKQELKLSHEPVGKLERAFDFRDPSKSGAKGDWRIATAADLVDTLTARLTILRRAFYAESIESYVEAGTSGRIAYQLGALLAPIAAVPWVRALTTAQINLLPSGPTPDELKDKKFVVVLEIEDTWRTKVIDWRWQTPNSYQFTAQIAVAVARKLANPAAGATPLAGWLTPADVLGPVTLSLPVDEEDERVPNLMLSWNQDALRDCHLEASSQA